MHDTRALGMPAAAPAAAPPELLGGTLRPSHVLRRVCSRLGAATRFVLAFRLGTPQAPSRRAATTKRWLAWVARPGPAPPSTSSKRRRSSGAGRSLGRRPVQAARRSPRSRLQRPSDLNASRRKRRPSGPKRRRRRRGGRVCWPLAPTCGRCLQPCGCWPLCSPRPRSPPNSNSCSPCARQAKKKAKKERSGWRRSRSSSSGSGSSSDSDGGGRVAAARQFLAAQGLGVAPSEARERGRSPAERRGDRSAEPRRDRGRQRSRSRSPARRRW